MVVWVVVLIAFSQPFFKPLEIWNGSLVVTIAGFIDALSWMLGESLTSIYCVIESHMNSIWILIMDLINIELILIVLII